MFIQGGLEPVFVGFGDTDSFCASCGHVLARSCHARALIAVAIECFRCHEITWTTPWPDDEPLPLLLLDGGGLESRFLIQGSSQLLDRVAIASKPEIERIDRLTGARPDLGSPLDLNPEGFREMESVFGSALTGFKSAMGKARRARLVGNTKHRDCMVAWSLLHLSDRITAGQLSMIGEDGAAIACLQMTGALIRRWQHHPLFPTFSAGLVHEYPHALAQLVAAAWLWDTKHRVGFTKLPERGRSPDLFVNRGPSVQVALEVKAPAELQWPHPLPDESRLVKIVSAQAKAARGQLSEEHGGLMVLGSTCHSPSTMDALLATVRELGRRHQLSKRLAGVIAITGSQGVAVRLDESRRVSAIDFSCRTEWIPNPDYELESFIAPR